MRGTSIKAVRPVLRLHHVDLLQCRRKIRDSGNIGGAAAGEDGCVGGTQQFEAWIHPQYKVNDAAWSSKIRLSRQSIFQDFPLAYQRRMS